MSSTGTGGRNGVLDIPQSSNTREPPPLPQELVDLVIDQVAYDGDLCTLQTCCLIASSWLPRCRSHLFNAVYLHPNNFVQMEDRFRPSNFSPTNATLIAQYVRRVLIHAGTRDEDEQPVPRDSELRVALLALFPNVDKFDFVNMRWGGLRPDVRAYFVPPPPSLSRPANRITSLIMTDIVFPKLADLVVLIGSLRVLQVLHLRNVVWEEEGDRERREEDGNGGHGGPGLGLGGPSSSVTSSGAGSGVPQRPQLRDVEIYECTSPGAFISHLFTGNGSITGESLHRLALDWRGREEEPDILRNLILAAGASLQILEVDLSWQQPGVPLDLHLSLGLKELYLDGLLLDDSDDGSVPPNLNYVGWIPAVLTGLSSRCMRKVVCYLILSYLSSLQRLDLEEMDAVLSRPQFETIECVAFSITILPNSGVVPPRRGEIWEAIRRRMGRVDGRGILKLMRDGIIVS